MPSPTPTAVCAKDLQGFKYLNEVLPLLQRLHPCGTDTDKAGNRRFFADHYAALLLLSFFNPVLTSRNALLQASRLAKVQAFCGGRSVSAGSFSEAQHLFDTARLEGLVRELAGRVPDAQVPKDWDCLKNLTAVDGSLLPALPRMVWALWLDDAHKAAKMHVHFEVLRGIPVQATVTTGNDSEKQQLRQTLDKDRLYVIDRGYAEYQLFQDILDAGSQFVGRIRDNAVWEAIEQRSVSEAAWAAGVRSDRMVWLGCEQSKKALRQPVRVLEVATGKVDGAGRSEVLLLASSCLEMVAELVGLAYKFRWEEELFFRWFKCVLGRRHLVSESLDGLTVQVYVALIANLLLTLWAGKKPTKRTFEMFCLFFMGWATKEELQEHLERLKEQRENSS
jgi:Transposase DDE domain